MPLSLWDNFCAGLNVARDAVPLFETDENGAVAVKLRGKAAIPILKRSALMDALILQQTDRLHSGFLEQDNRYDGLIYMMFYLRGGKVVPLYIGKTESKGTRNPVSANIKDLHIDTGKFARWGDSYAYHIGDLSAVVLPGHLPVKQTIKYQRWAETLFVSYPSTTPVLKEPVYFWCQAWDKTSTGIWAQFGATRLTFLEYLMIGVASAAFPGLLNFEGRNRAL